MKQHTEAEIHIVSYDESWQELFNTEKSLLSGVIGEFLTGPIEHVGSTAVPGLAAKPVIDIMAGVKSLDASRPAISILGKYEYCYYPYRLEIMHWFCKPSPQFRTHHLHLVPYNSKVWNERLAFRDYLRSHSDVVQEYAELKYRLAEQYRFDREKYTEAKTTFIKNILNI